MHACLLISSVLFLVCLSPRVFGNQLPVFMPQHKGWVESESRGFAAELLAASLAKADIKVTSTIELQVLPINRAARYFGSNKPSCFFGGDQDLAQKLGTGQVLQSRHFFETSVRFYTMDPRVPLRSMADLGREEFVGITPGLKHLLKLPELKLDPDRIVEYSSIELAAEALRKKRISHILHSSPLWLGQELDLKFDKRFSVWTIRESIICHPSDSARRLIQSFNQGLQQVIAGGQYDRLWLKHFQKADKPKL